MLFVLVEYQTFSSRIIRHLPSPGESKLCSMKAVKTISYKESKIGLAFVEPLDDTVWKIHSFKENDCLKVFE
jgi:hypothetical protein